MARCSSTSSESTHIQLRWARARLEIELAKQITAGEHVATALATTSSTAAALAEVNGTEVEEQFEKPISPRRWHDRSRTILSQAFTTARVVNEYDPPVLVASVPLDGSRPSQRAQLEEVRRKHAKRLDRLRGVADRIDLYEEAPDVARPGVFSGPRGGQIGADATVFVVHGRDDGAKETVARFLTALTGAEPVILHEQASAGATVIEKFERHAGDAGFAVVILSPDDEGRLADSGDALAARARQNVIYELGWFHGRLGRGNVVALLVDNVEQPSDIVGVLYVRMGPGEGGAPSWLAS